MHSSQAICFFLCPLYMGKDILTIGDKNRLDARKHKKEVRVGESCCTVHALPLQPCLVCTLGRWQDLMFHQLLSHSITATPFAAVIPLCAAAKNHMHCAVWTALHLSGAATNNRKRGINQISRVRHRICFSLVISCPILCPRPLLSPSCSTDVKQPPPDVYHDPHYISVVISQTQKIHCIMWSFFWLPYPLHSFTNTSIMMWWSRSYALRRDKLHSLS